MLSGRKVWGWWGGVVWGLSVTMTCISIMVLRKSSLCNQQVELMTCKVWQGCPLKQKKRAKKEACAFAFCSGADGASVIHMHEAGGCQPITLTLAMGLWPWDWMEENGTSLSCGVKAWSYGWEKGLSFVTPVFQAVIESVEECRFAFQHLPGHMQFMLVNDGWRGRTNEKMSQRHFCIWGRCLGKEHNLQLSCLFS